MLPLVRQSVLNIYYADLLGQVRGKYLKKMHIGFEENKQTSKTPDQWLQEDDRRV